MNHDKEKRAKGADHEPPARRKAAVALRYDALHDPAPRVVAKGRGVLADRIVALAQAHGVHVHEDPDFVALLAALDIDAPIPEELYRAAAEVLAFVYRVNKRASE